MRRRSRPARRSPPRECGPCLASNFLQSVGDDSRQAAGRRFRRGLGCLSEPRKGIARRLADPGPMPVCERCHLDNPPGRHFCLECGYYVQWEPTAEQPVASRRGAPRTLTQPGVPPRRVEPPERRPRRDPLGGVALSLAVPGESASPNRPVAVSVEAGGEAQLAALVRNRGEVVDHYEIRVDGIPDGW